MTQTVIQAEKIILRCVHKQKTSSAREGQRILAGISGMKEMERGGAEKKEVERMRGGIKDESSISASQTGPAKRI